MSDAPPDLWIGRLVGGRFRVTTKLGSGGWAVVYRARDEQADLGDVALKIPTVSREESLKLFAEEGRQLRKVEHPHVVSVYDVVKATEDDPRPVLVLGLMRGSLEKVLDEAPGRLQPPAVVAAWLTPVAGALDYLHLQLKKVHRDVKPANILFDGAGQPRLSDFGIVFSLAPGSRTRKLGQDSSLGTPIYMAPELLLSAVEPSATSDQYALACTAFEALSGRLPFPVPDVGDDTRFQILWARAVDLNEPTPLAKAAPHVPVPAAAAIDRALSKDPSKRFASCGALADAFREGLRPPPPVEPPVRPPEPPIPGPGNVGDDDDLDRRIKNRRRAIAVISIAGIGIGVLLWVGLRKTQSSDSVATTSPPPTEITLVVDEPANGDLVGSRDVRVTGRATGPADLIAPVKPPYEAYLRGFAVAVGTELDAATGYPKKIRRLKDDGEMVLIPAGTFQMGKVPSDSNDFDIEKPRHAVTLTKAYYLDVNEVTVGQWKRFVADGRGRLPTTPLLSEATDRHPIHDVNHTEATAFATWAGATLPTEAQWERAAKGGRDNFVYPWGVSDDMKKRNGREDDDGFTHPAPVRSYPPTDYGLYDMSGNVWEWCSDWYESSYYASSPSRDPSGPGSGSARAVRGGSWYDGDVNLRASARDFADPSFRFAGRGFRLARSL